MNQLIFGRRNKLRFASENEFYESLGFLTKSDGTTTIVWEHNETSGAWGSEGRIQCYKNLSKFPTALRRKFTAGRGVIRYRINCNEYIDHIIQFHQFQLGSNQNYTNIKLTVPKQYRNDFDLGYNLLN